MRINLRDLRNALRWTKRTGPQPGVVLRCRKVPEDNRATLTLEDTVRPGEAVFLSEPEEQAAEAVDQRVRLDRTKLEQIAERWDETNAELTMTESILRDREDDGAQPARDRRRAGKRQTGRMPETGRHRHGAGDEHRDEDDRRSARATRELCAARTEPLAQNPGGEPQDGDTEARDRRWRPSSRRETGPNDRLIRSTSDGRDARTPSGRTSW